jgi:hypothetical protein
MGHTTDFLGHIDIHPPLNQDEVEYLLAFAGSRRFDREGGPYAVPGNPRAEERESVDVDTYNRTAPGQPQLWCQWVPCPDGCCLSFDGREKFYEPVRWMRYLIDHFLKPSAVASASGLPWFELFTFDHVLNGTIVGCRRDTRELFMIVVRNNRVTTKVLRPGDPQPWERPALAYEVEIDRRRSERRRRRVRREPGQVIDLAERRGS